MQFTNEVNWSIADFLVMGVLLIGAGLTLEFFFRKVKKRNQRILIAGAVLLLFLLVWAELAVGIVGTPLAGS
jgi:type II secretory pathway component PulM